MLLDLVQITVLGLLPSRGPSRREMRKEYKREREKYNEHRKYATSLIAKHRKDIQTKTADYEMIANSQYAFASWWGGFSTSFVGACRMAGKIDIPIILPVCFGFLGASVAQTLHIAHHMRAAVNEIDHAINTLKPLHDIYGVPPYGLTEYSVEISALNSMREHQAPGLKVIEKEEADAIRMAFTLLETLFSILFVPV